MRAEQMVLPGLPAGRRDTKARYVLREYQKACKYAVLHRLLVAEERATLGVLATGLGKTQIAAAVAEQWPRGRVLWIAHRDELLSQAQRRIEAMTGELTSLEQAGWYASGTRIVVGSVQTLKEKRLERFPEDAFGLIVVDECFPAGTVVDGMKIETIQPGDKVWSLDHETGQVSLRRVVRRMERQAPVLHTLTCDAAVVTCTPNHPFFVRGFGYVTADQIIPGDMLAVWQDVRDAERLGPRDVLRRVQAKEVIGDHGSYQPGPRLGEDEAEQPDAQGFLGEDARDAIAYWAQAAGARWQWARPHETRGLAGTRSWVRDECVSAHQDAKGMRVSDPLQTGRGEQGQEDRHRGGRIVAQRAIPTGARPEEGRVLVWSRVESISRHEQGSAGGAPVYNLEVEGSHTYFANGILVHNCHHAVSPSYRKVFNHFSGAKLFGITATADRLDKVGQHNVFDSVAFRKDIDEGIGEGYLVPILAKSELIDSVNLANIKTVAGDLALDAVEEQILKAAAAIVDATLAHVGDRRSLTFTPGVESAHKVCDTHNERHPGSAHVVDGKTHPDKRREIFRAHKRGEFQHLINCMVATEGYDDVGISAVVNARPTKSRALATQIWGRGLRVLDGIGELATIRDRLSAITRSAKPNCLLLDITGEPGKHKLISPVDLLGGKYTKDEVDRAKERVKKGAEEIRDALEEVRREIRVEEDERVKAMARAAAEAEVRRRSGQWDPFLDGGIKDPDALRPAHLAKPSTPRQKHWARENFLDPNLSCERLSKLWKDNFIREKFGKPGFRMLGQLRQHGVDDMALSRVAAVSILNEAARLRGTPPREWIDNVIAKDKGR